MKVLSIFLPMLLCACNTPAILTGDDTKTGVWCSSRDEGKTCWAYGENYPDGTGDSCGREPTHGVDFALKLRHEFSGNTMCETVEKSSHPNVMAPGERFCSVTIEKLADGYTYRFTDDPPDKVRHSYRSDRSKKWCQPLIDAL